MRIPPRALPGILLFSILALFFSNPVIAQQLTRTCKFDKGPRAGLTITFYAAKPQPAGAPCQDGVASTGLAVPDNPHPQLTHSCHFDQGPRAGQTQVYPQLLPVGAYCVDGAGSGGYTLPDNTTAPEPAKLPTQNSANVPPQSGSVKDQGSSGPPTTSNPNQPKEQNSPDVSRQRENQPTQQPVQAQNTQQQETPGHNPSTTPESPAPSAKSGLVSRALTEAEAFKQAAGIPDARSELLMHMGTSTLLYGLRAASSAGDVDRTDSQNLSSIENGASNIGDTMKLPGARGTDQWSVLCLDLAKLIASSGYRRKFYCPAAEAIFAKMYPPQPKHAWPDPTEPVRSFADDKKSLPPNAPSFLVPGILSQLYAGNWKNVADDENTRNYAGTILREEIKKCPEFDSPDVEGTVLNYLTHFEFKNQQKQMRDARSGNLGGFLQTMTGMLPVASPHRDQFATYDADLVIQHYGCNGEETKQLASNLIQLAGNRGDLAPDVPNNEFYRAQLSQLGRQSLTALKYSDQDAASMRSLRKSCEDMYGSVWANQESFCRCQALMMVRSGLPQPVLDRLDSKFDIEELDGLARNYPSYGQLRSACYD